MCSLVIQLFQADILAIIQRGLSLAREDVQMDPGGLTKTASIIPSVDYTHLEEALVITNYAGFADFLREEGKDPNKNIKGGAGR